MKASKQLISASRRTDIPAFFAGWFMNRVREGNFVTQHPWILKQVKQVSLNPSEIAGFMFWSKNPTPLLKHLDELDDLGYQYVFHFSITGLPNVFEPNVLETGEMIEVFQQLSDRIGVDRMFWRYDPLLLTTITDYAYHQDRFAGMAEALAGYTKRVYTSFFKYSPKPWNNMRELENQGIHLLNESQDSPNLANMLSSMVTMARSQGMKLLSCACEHDLSEYGINPGACADGELLRELFGTEIKSPKGYKLRDNCNCVCSIDMGAYGTCKYHCEYCYADLAPETAASKLAAHNPDSPVLVGWPSDFDHAEWNPQSCDECPLQGIGNGCEACPITKVS